MWRRFVRLLRAVIGDDETAGVWQRLTPDGAEVLRLGFVDARELGHPCLADEHVLLGILRHGSSDAAGLLRSRGVDAAAVRAELVKIGRPFGPRVDQASALRTLGIEVEEVRRRLDEAFGAQAREAAERRVRRRPRWRGGRPGPTPLCAYLLAKRSLAFAAELASRRGDTGIGPEHLLYGVLRDARDPLGTELSRRGRKQLAALDWTTGGPNPLRLVLEARGVDPTRMAAQLLGTQRA
jgi:ATP-dependent Clp protease ATP-binding subunit ClpA